MDVFYSALFLFLIGTVTCEWTTKDDRTKIIRCFQQIMTYGDITNLLIDVSTKEAIDNFCQRHSDLLKCTRDNEHLMTVEELAAYQRNISGVNNFHLQVCPPGSDITEDYTENAKCFKLAANKILYCGSGLSDINSYRMKSDIYYRCCALEQHRECVKLATREKCGDAAADVAEKILLRFFNRQIKPCNIPTHGCEYKGPTTVQDWTTTPHKGKDGHTIKWNFYSTEDDRHPNTEQEWKRTTAGDENTIWTHPTDANAWKKHKHNSAITPTLNSMISVLSCLGAVLLQKL